MRISLFIKKIAHEVLNKVNAGKGHQTCDFCHKYKNRMLTSKPILRLGAIPFVIKHICNSKLLKHVQYLVSSLRAAMEAKEDLFSPSFFPARGSLTKLLSIRRAKLFYL